MAFMDNLTKKQKRTFKRVALALVLFAVVSLVPKDSLVPAPYALYVEFALYLMPYLLAGYDVLLKAGRSIVHGQVFDENFLMSVATIGAFALVFFPEAEPHMAEGAAVMLFYQVGELFQGYAVGKSRKSIAAMMDIAPDYANVVRNGEACEVDPDEVGVGEVILVKPGERVPLDGVVVEGSSQLDTSALTGESLPRQVSPESECISGCINLTGAIQVRVTCPYGQSTVQRILELVENASEKKARTENFITRFARYYTPVVVFAALALAVIPPLAGWGAWSAWVQRALVFLVVSCPCALVISVPLSFFGGIGGASRLGILVKGGNYLETLAKVDAVVFDKTGTLTTGRFAVREIHAAPGFAEEELARLAAHAEAFSSHPIAASIRDFYKGAISQNAVSQVQEQGGMGVRALVDGRSVAVGGGKLLQSVGVAINDCPFAGTVVYVAVDGEYAGWLGITDVLKPDAESAVQKLHGIGMRQLVMLTGDRREAALGTAEQLGIDFRCDLLPQQKVEFVEQMLVEKASGNGKVAFVGDGINDAPVLMRADIGIAMGAMGSGAAIEAADVVLMDDKPSNIARAVRLARKTMGIVWENIVFAIGVKLVILILAALGVATMWLAVFGDVGVAVIAILNAMRAMNTKGIR